MQKFSFNLTDDAAAAVRDLAAKHGTSVTEVIRRGLSLERFILEQLEGGGTFYVERDGLTQAVHFVF